MKNTFKLLTVIGSLGLFFACNDAIDIDQPGRLSADAAFQTVGDLQSGLFGALGTLDNTQQIQFNSIFTDEVGIGPSSGGQGLGDGSYGFVLNASSAAPNAIWTRAYFSLNAINRVIEAVDLVDAGDDQVAEDEILGQLLALRAYVNFQIVTYFSPDYTDDSALAGILLDFVPTPDQLLPRATNGEFFASIDQDLTMASNLISTQADPQAMSQDFISFLRLKMDVYREQYAGVDAAAVALLADYPLANRADYESTFFDTGNEEIIFELLRVINGPFDGQGATGSATAGGWAGANWAFVSADVGGAPYFDIGRALFDMIDPADVRFDVLVGQTSIISPDPAAEVDFQVGDVLLVSKYEGIPGQPLLNDLKIFRSSELVLFRAEAAAALGDLTAAAGFVQELRDARFGTTSPPPNFGSAAMAFGAILDERRIEFAFEGYRWVDLKRMGVRGNRGIQRNSLDCDINGACALPASDFRFTLPIPLVETNVNPDIIQNPGF